MMLYGFRERETILDIFEAATGLRMNHAYIRIGGVVMDLPDGATGRIGDFLETMSGRIDEYERLLTKNPIWIQRNSGVGVLPAEDALAFGVTGPSLRASGVARDVRRDEPYAGYEAFEFDVVTHDAADCYARYEVRDVRFVRPDVALVHKEAYAVTAGGEPIDLEHAMNALYVLVKQDGRWLVKARQNTLVPR